MKHQRNFLPLRVIGIVLLFVCVASFMVHAVVFFAGLTASRADCGLESVLCHVLQLLTVLSIVFAAFVFRVLFLDFLRKKFDPALVLPYDLFSDTDAEILQDVLVGEKYEFIAHKYGQSLNSFKKHIHVLFVNLGVTDKTIFLARYANHRVIRENPFL